MTYYIATGIFLGYLGDGDLYPFCSEFCRNKYADEWGWGEEYFILSDGPDYTEYCEQCGDTV